MRMIATEVELTVLADDRGSLVAMDTLTFGHPIARVFQVRDVPVGTVRGGHAHRSCHQLLVASQGTIVVTIHDGTEETTFRLDRPGRGLHIPPMTWASQTYVSDHAILTVLASHPFSESDYIRDFTEFSDIAAHG
jgi:dTDP-4-dehydrorhamnose 3,5-epimerase-like enzyme